MTNLITDKQKQANRRVYIIRLIALCLFIASLLGGFLLAYVIPYYIAVGKKGLKVDEQFKSVINRENKENVGASVSQIVSQTADQMKAVELYSQTDKAPSNYFQRIIMSKNSNIRLNRLSFVGGRDGAGQLLVGGVSRNRQALVVFIADLKSQGNFSSVEMPISDFAMDNDIAFTLNIKINK